MFRLLYTLLCWALVTCGFIAQLYSLVEQYLQYDVVTELAVKWPTHVTMPDLAICVDFHLAFSDKEYSEFAENNTLNVTHVASKLPKLNMIRASVQANNSYDFHHANSEHELKQHFKYYYGYKLEMSCLVIISLDKRITRSYMVTNNHLRAFYLVYFPLSALMHIPKVNFALKAHNSTFAGKIDSQIVVENAAYRDNTSGSISLLSYNFFQSKLLPYPYASNCHDYTEDGRLTQGSCREQCIRHLWETTHPGYVPFYVGLSDDSRLMNYSLVMQSTYGKRAQLYQPIIKQCKAKCKKIECYRRDHAVMQESVRRSNVYGIYMRIPKQPDVYSELKPSLSMINFLTAVASCISFWYGLSPLDVVINNAIVQRHFRRRTSCASDQNAALRALIAQLIELQQERHANDRRVNRQLAEKDIRIEKQSRTVQQLREELDVVHASVRKIFAVVSSLNRK